MKIDIWFGFVTVKVRWVAILSKVKFRPKTDNASGCLKISALQKADEASCDI